MEPKAKQSLAARIREAVAKSGRSKEAIAREMGVKSGDIRRWMKGQHAPRISTLMDLARATRQDPDFVFGLTDGDDVSAPESAVSEPAITPYAARIGGWFEALPEDIQAVTYFLGLCLNDPAEFQRFATIARKALHRMERGIPASTGTGRTRRAAATPAGRQKKASGR